MKPWKDNVYFTLVEPREPGNIGACARAIKNMDFKKLCLVNPPALMTDEAQWFARNSLDVLDSAETRGSVHDAIRDKHYVVGTSRRRGKRRGAFLPVEEGARRIFEIAHTNKVAVLFGREDRGLFNEEVEECAFLMTIPANKKQPSLNLAQAVMIVSYELMMGNLAYDPSSKLKLAPLQQTEAMYAQLEQALLDIGFLHPQNARHMMFALRRMLGRAGMESSDVGVLRGIARQIGWYSRVKK